MMWLQNVLQKVHTLILPNQHTSAMNSVHWKWGEWAAHQGSKVVCRLEWLFMAPLSAAAAGPLLWTLLSWKELSGRGEGTIEQSRAKGPILATRWRNG